MAASYAEDMEILLYALIAAFFAWRLYATLGTRHEGERQRPNPFATPDDTVQGNRAKESDPKNLLALPLNKPLPAPSMQEASAPAPDSLSGALYALQKAEPNFDEKAFLKGARVAFEMIVHAFAAQDREALKNLMSPVLFEAFTKAMDEHKQKGERVEMKLLNLREAHLSAARMDGRMAYVTVEFTSDQSRVIYSGDTVQENAGTQRLHDIWTFRRETGSPDPNWLLVETKTG
ncbi:MAG: Tim44 domain-containing protein [Proteobacteria bacterium]|nr:Tim44 domain-containing protein [Pseudomonadota bacterium]